MVEWGIVGKLLKPFLDLINSLINFFKPKDTLPKQTVRIVNDIPHCWWGTGSVNGKLAMQVHYDGHVTNITDKNAHLLAAYIERPKTHGMVITRHPGHDIYGDYVLMSNHTVPFNMLFFVQPPTLKEGKEFKCDIVVIDHLNNKHKLRGVVFRSLAKS